MSTEKKKRVKPTEPEEPYKIARSLFKAKTTEAPAQKKKP